MSIYLAEYGHLANLKLMQLSDFQFDLPSDLIAKYPLATRSASRLLCLEGDTGKIAHHQFTDILNFLKPHDLIVFNNTKVIPARLKGNKLTGGKVEMLVERILDAHTVLAHLKASKALRPDMEIDFGCEKFVIQTKQDELYTLVYQGRDHVLNIIEQIGEIPLPPYFQREPEESDKTRYQTVYAEHKGSVAAPTAGLHFDEHTLTALKNKNVQQGFLTLHVGAGTFAPVRCENITEHKMHQEWLEVSQDLVDQVQQAKKLGGRIIAVGTTSLRSLESAAQSGKLAAYAGYTDIFIYPGYEFKCVDALITNLHTPGSSLLMLVSAFAGVEAIKAAYSEAVALKYRFYSYGDAMFMTRKNSSLTLHLKP